MPGFRLDLDFRVGFGLGHVNRWDRSESRHGRAGDDDGCADTGCLTIS